jgi:hypothetical protein
MEQTRAGYWTAAIFFAALLLIMALLAPLVPGLPFIGGLILIFYLPVLCVQYGLAVALILAAWLLWPLLYWRPCSGAFRLPHRLP